ncbi:MAG: autotransporter-associated beta strand repeat-containing protein [Prevotella sp.]|nr:autotransporter-associated beta strand repeat-containing protein [Candidatus Prevotella equi]
MNIFKKLFTLMTAAVMGFGTVHAEDLVAFPGAQGFGRYALGARASSSPTVYHVTNLNDSGTGSLRDAVSQPNRIVVFDVAGVIKLNSIIVFKNNLYVAGQTAPGEGITVYGGRVSFSGATNTIVRYMRFRLGHAAGQVDCAGAANGNNMIFDHCSFGWGGDETFSLNPDGKNGGLYNITLSNSIMGQGLMPHSAGGLVQTEYVTLYRNLYCDNATRNNKIKGINQYANNIVYNWKDAAYNMGGGSEGESYCNIESNLFINGPAKGGAAFTGGNSNFHFYGNDNWQDSNMDGKYDPFEVTSYSGADRQSKPYDYPELELYKGNELLEKNLPNVGATLPYRDYVDYYMVDEIMSYGKKGTLISDESTLAYGIPTAWTVWKGETRVDSDKDGMPDAWETANGTNPNVNDATVKAANGYLNIENYINSIGIEDRQFFLRTPMLVEQESATTTTMTITWRDWTFEEEGFIVEIQNNRGIWNEVARTKAGATSVVVSGLTPGTQYQVRLCAFAGEKKSDYTEEMKMSTRPEVVGMIDPDTYVPEHTLSTFGNVTWNEGLVWNNNTAAYEDGMETLIAPTENTTVNITNALIPTNVVVKGDADVTFTGSGDIAGDGSLNKAGKGTLTINTQNSYRGATVLHDGVLEFNSIANGGMKSALGAAVEFAQNWIWDGGTYRYTGGKATTNRSFQLLNNTTLEIADASTTLTMSGSKIEGAGNTASDKTFELDGKGQLAPTGSLFEGFNGAVKLTGGDLYIDCSTAEERALFNGIKKMIFNGGSLTTKGTTSGDETYSFPIEVVEGTTTTFTPNRVCHWTSKVTGSGTIKYNIPYVREYIRNFSGFTGRLIANGLNGGASDGAKSSLLLLDSGYENALQNCVVDLQGIARLAAWQTNATCNVGGVAGASTAYIGGSSKNTNGFTTTWNIGGANTDETFNGKTNNWAGGSASASGTVNINKVGYGLWRLTNSSLEHKGTTNVQAGTLVMNGKLTASRVTVSSGATLKGEGTISQAVTLNAGATLEAGDTLVNGKGITFASTLSIGANCAVNIPLTSKKCNTITLNNKLTIGEGVSLSFDSKYEGLDRAPYDKTEYQIFNLGATASITGEFSDIETTVLEEGQSWDTTDLYTKGILRVVGGEQKPQDDPQDDPIDDPDPVGPTMKVSLAFGNMTNKSYDGSGTLNMLEGNENKTTNGVLNDNRGFKWVCTGNLTKALSKGAKMTYDFDGTQRTNVKISNGAQQTIFLPEDPELGKARATKIEFWSTVGTNSQNRTSYWREVCGVEYTSSPTNIISLVSGEVTCVTFDLPNVEQITFTNAGEQQQVIVNIEYHYGGPAGLPYDVNKDGVENKADAETIVAYYLGNNPSNIDMTKADVNGDKKITIADANALINKLK